MTLSTFTRTDTKQIITSAQEYAANHHRGKSSHYPTASLATRMAQQAQRGPARLHTLLDSMFDETTDEDQTATAAAAAAASNCTAPSRRAAGKRGFSDVTQLTTPTAAAVQSAVKRARSAPAEVEARVQQPCDHSSQDADVECGDSAASNPGHRGVGVVVCADAGVDKDNEEQNDDDDDATEVIGDLSQQLGSDSDDANDDGVQSDHSTNSWLCSDVASVKHRSPIASTSRNVNKLFSGLVVYIYPSGMLKKQRDALAASLQRYGAEIIADNAQDQRITHVVVADRLHAGNTDALAAPGRVIVNTKWQGQCIRTRSLIPPDMFAPPLPPERSQASQSTPEKPQDPSAVSSAHRRPWWGRTSSQRRIGLTFGRMPSKEKILPMSSSPEKSAASDGEGFAARISPTIHPPIHGKDAINDDSDSNDDDVFADVVPAGATGDGESSKSDILAATTTTPTTVPATTAALGVVKAERSGSGTSSDLLPVVKGERGGVDVPAPGITYVKAERSPAPVPLSHVAAAASSAATAIDVDAAVLRNQQLWSEERLAASLQASTGDVPSDAVVKKQLKDEAYAQYRQLAAEQAVMTLDPDVRIVSDTITDASRRYLDRNAHKWLFTVPHAADQTTGRLSHNDDIIKMLQEQQAVHQARNDKMHVLGYNKAIQAVRKYPKRIESEEEAKKIFNVGAKTANKIGIFLATNKFQRDRSDLDDARALFMGVWGAGAASVNEWINKGWRTLQDLHRNIDQLTEAQQIGVQMYHDFKARIPRDEVELIEDEVRMAGKKVRQYLQMFTCGSYRRGKATCGDIDILITHPDRKSEQGVLHPILEILKDQGMITHDLAYDASTQGKYMGVFRLPGLDPTTNQPYLHRRIDLIVVPYPELPFSLLYFTGSGHFNRSMRHLANKYGFSLSQHGLVPAVRAQGNKVSEGPPIKGIRTEADIFRILGAEYVPPDQRNV